MGIKRPSQKEIILSHLAKVGPITSLEAIEKYKITRLSAVICELKKAGHRIRTEDIIAATGTRFAKYELEEPESP